MILELLRDAPGFKCSSNEKAIAFAINESDVALVGRVIKNYGLFDFDSDGLLMSPWLLKAMGAYSDKKQKLQEAGRKGAAKRWATAHGSDGQAIATPSVEDGQAIAHNITQCNVTEHNETISTPTSGERVDVDYLDLLCKTEQAGHAAGYVAQVCLNYGMLRSTCDTICERTDNANISNPTYGRFVALVKRIQGEKWVPKHPDGFFLKKLFE